MRTIVDNWEYVGGARGTYVIRPRDIPLFSNYVEFLFAVMVVLAVLSVVIAWVIENSWIGRGLAAIRDNEEAAEGMGVPVLKLKLFATTVSGFMMGVAGAPFPYYITYLEPVSAFSLDYAVNSLAMPLIGGTTTWMGPVIGAVLLGTAQQVLTVHDFFRVGPLLRGGRAGGFRHPRARRNRRSDQKNRRQEGNSMNDKLLDVQSVTKRFGGFHALTEVSIHVNNGERFGLIGPNGSGKTTLINCVSGALPCDGRTGLFRWTQHYDRRRIQARPDGGSCVVFRSRSHS